MKVWAYIDGAIEPEEVDVPEGSTYDSRQQRVHENTHFADKAEAWECVLRNAKARVSLSAQYAKEAREKVRQWEAECTNAAILWNEATTAYERESRQK